MYRTQISTKDLCSQAWIVETYYLCCINLQLEHEVSSPYHHHNIFKWPYSKVMVRFKRRITLERGIRMRNKTQLPRMQEINSVHSVQLKYNHCVVSCTQCINLSYVSFFWNSRQHQLLNFTSKLSKNQQKVEF